MSPFSMAHVIDQVVRDRAARMALDEQEEGRGRGIPASLYLERIAERLGVTKRMLYRYMEGSTSPAANTLIQICLICGSTLPWEWGCRELGLGYYRRDPAQPAERPDIVGIAAHIFQDAGRTMSDVMKDLEDGKVTPTEAKRLAEELDDLADGVTTMKAAVASYLQDKKPPIPFNRDAWRRASGA